MPKLLPVSALLPTRNRAVSLCAMLNSLAQQQVQPVEIIIIDASDNEESQKLCEGKILNLDSSFIYHKATEMGAATQRNQAMRFATQDFIWLIEDDISFEKDCLERLWQALQSDSQVGGVNAMITNQKYLPPGKVTSHLFRFLYGCYQTSYAGKCIGPALNLLPEDNPSLPEVVPVEWLNTGCTLYRREALPDPLFPPIFTGYSLMEDVTLSLTVGKKWKLANARTAKIFHDSQPGDYKSNPEALAKMELINRHFVMTQILERRKLQDYLKLLVLQLFQIAALLQTSQGWKSLPLVLKGKLDGIVEIIQSVFSSTQRQFKSE
jgi:glycosyltransferase involved in cell wall biosynthesis